MPQVKRARPSPLSEPIRFSWSLRSCAISFSSVLLLKCSQSSFLGKFGSVTGRSTYFGAPFISGGRILAVKKLGALNVDVSTSPIGVVSARCLSEQNDSVYHQQRATSHEVHSNSQRDHMECAPDED